MKILVYTGFDDNKGYKETGLISAPNKAEYAFRHGYDFLCNRNYVGFDRPISWFKIKEILRLLPRYDYIFWSDADAVITNLTLSLEKHLINSTIIRPEYVNVSPSIEPEPVKTSHLVNTDYIIAYDDYSPCMGNFIIKNTPWAIKFFEAIYNQTQFMNDPIWDNRAQDWLIYNNPTLTENIKFVPKGHINSMIHDWKEGDFMIHFAATEMPRRVILMDRALSKFTIK